MAQKSQKMRSERSSFGHWMRVAVMFMTGGFAFPHAMTENDDAGGNVEKKLSAVGETPQAPLPRSGVK
jgi:hypothetical protein